MGRNGSFSHFDGFVFSRTVGLKSWCCPRCNQMNQTTINPGIWRIKCGNEECGITWAIGEVFYAIGHGFKAPPPDTILPRAEPYHSGEPVNKVYCESCSKVIYEDVFHRALEAGADPEDRYGRPEILSWMTAEYRRGVVQRQRLRQKMKRKKDVENGEK